MPHHPAPSHGADERTNSGTSTGTSTEASARASGDDEESTAERHDRALLTRYLTGDRTALSELVTRHHRRLLALVARTVPGIDADAVVQDTWATVLAKADTFREEGSVSGWLSRIARHRALDVARHERRSATTAPGTLTDLTDLGPGAAADTSAEAVAVARAGLPHAWSWLTAEHREVLWLTTVLDLSVDDVAARLRLSPSTVKSRAARARAALRAALAHGRPRPQTRRGEAPDTTGRPGTRAVPAEPSPPPQPPQLDEALAQLTAGQRGDAAASFEAALAQLTVGQREAVTAIDLEGLSVSAAAARAGVSPDSMRERWERARANLRRLQGHGPAAVSTRARRGPTG